MKKFALLLVIVMLTVLFSSCSKEYMEFEELNDGSKLKYGNTVYVFYGALPKASLKGKQIGIIGGDKKHKVFEVKGYSSDEWIIEYYDVIMSVYSLYKAESVTDIPEDFSASG
ncbi:MAG: hypothetical protein ACOX3Q_10585 [Clostridia bacterium]|jgi:hypothetical protein